MNEKLNAGVYVGKPYRVTDAIRILNQKQAAFYWENGVLPVDIYPSKDFETGEPIIVYVFIKDETKKLYTTWIDRKNQTNQN